MSRTRKIVFQAISIFLLAIGVVIVFMGCLKGMTLDDNGYVAESGSLFALFLKLPSVPMVVIGAVVALAGTAVGIITSRFKKGDVTRSEQHVFGRTEKSAPLPDLAVCDLCGTKNAADAETCSFCGKHEFTIMAQ